MAPHLAPDAHATPTLVCRRMAELYGVNPYTGRLYTSRGMGAYNRSPWENDFWDEFESGRRGVALQEQRARAHADAFFRLQLLQMLMTQRGHEDEYDDDDMSDDDGDEYDTPSGPTVIAPSHASRSHTARGAAWQVL